MNISDVTGSSGPKADKHVQTRMHAQDMGSFTCYVTQYLGGGRVSDLPAKSVTKMYGSALLALRRGGWVSNFQKKSVT